MLTNDLVLVQQRRGVIQPRYIEAELEEHRELAASLLDVFERHLERPRFELDAELEELLGTGTAFLLHRGLAKLLFDRSEFDTRAALEPAELRRQIFEAAARETLAAARQEGHEPAGRARLVAELCQRAGLTPEQFEHSLYADLKDQQILAAFRPWTPAQLLRRYNVALAQGVLLKAQALKLSISGQKQAHYRALFRKIKFFQLLHRIRGNSREGYEIELDGPLSLFKASQKYGVQMASFLPTLLHFQGWRLSASLLWGKRRTPRSFELSSATGLHPYTRLTGQWLPEELSWLPGQFAELDTGWEVSSDARLIDLGGQGVLVPDFLFRHRESGREVFMEIFGFWNRGAVQSRLELLRNHGPSNLILAVSKSLAGEEVEAGDLPGEVYVYRSTPLAREVAKRLKSFEEPRRTH